MAISLNIQRFNDGFVDPSAWNGACGATDAAAGRYGDTTGENKTILDKLKEILGAAKPAAEQQELFTAMTTVVAGAADYLHSIDSWSKSVMAAFHSFTLTEEPDHTNTETVEAQHYNQVEDRFQGRNIGVSSQAEIDAFASEVMGVIPEITSALQNVSSSVDSAEGSIPDIISSAFSSTVSEQNAKIQEAISRINSEIQDNATNFK